jgi:ribosome maturation factor RimP
MANSLREQIRALITPPIEAAGYELVDVEWGHEQGGWVCRVLLDNSEGKVGLEDCEQVSRQLSAILDVNDVIPQHYSLEVSSPGLDRPLRTPAHFKRFVGQSAKVRLKAGVDGRRNYSGKIVAVSADDKQITVEVDGKEYVLPLDDLDKANLDYKF